MQIQLWRHILGLIAIATGTSLAIMSVLGSFETFSQPGVQYAAAAIGSGADLGILSMPFAFRDFARKGRKLALWLAIGFWGAFSIWTIASSATWLRHTLEMTQKPVEQQRLTETQRQNKLNYERGHLAEADRVAVNGATQSVRDNARKEADATRARIKELENTNTFQTAAAEVEPVKSPFAGYELLVAIGLWAASQGLWFLAYGEAEPASKSAAQKGSGTGHRKHGAASPAPMGQSLKSKENLLRPAMGQEAGQSGLIIPMRRAAKPRPSEIIAMRQRGMSQRSIGEAFGVSARTIRRILEGAADGAHAAQTA